MPVHRKITRLLKSLRNLSAPLNKEGEIARCKLINNLVFLEKKYYPGSIAENEEKQLNFYNDLKSY